MRSGGNSRSRGGIDRMPPEPGSFDDSVLGGRVLRGDRQGRSADGPPDAFGLFCAYYLGITPDDGYQKPNADEVARRHGLTPDRLKELLAEYELEPAKVRASSFDLEGAQLDIRLAPAGISRTEAAKSFYDEYLACIGK